MKEKKTIILIGIVSLLFIIVVANTLLYTIYYFPLNIEKSPLQPINFSHKRHVKESRIRCQYCHLYARRSTVAGIPFVKNCINCHEEILSESKEVGKIFDYWQKREPIPWVRVYDLPDFVYFSHKRHIKRDILCKECHGNVSEMSRVKKVRSLRMGWCINCHKNNRAEIDCVTCHK